MGSGGGGGGGGGILTIVITRGLLLVGATVCLAATHGLKTSGIASGV